MSSVISVPSTFNTFVLPKLDDVRPDVFVRRDQLPAALLAAEADTLGWDSVNAITLSKVNEALSARGRYPKSFDSTIQPGWTLDGTFGTWRLVRGGSGSIVFLRTPLLTAHMTFTGSPDLSFADGWATVAIKLQYLPQPRSADPASGDDPVPGNTEYLVADAHARSEDDPAAVIQAIDYGS